MASFSPNIPLHCSICPKAPNFSDVSHLLTHISSKGHLSHYYKVQIRAASEDGARQQVDAYNTWYTEWGIEHLMSDRMNLKDKRRTRTRTANARRHVESTPQDALRRKAVSGNNLDPRLSEQLIKNEPTPSPSPQPTFQPYPGVVWQPQQENNVWPSPQTTGSNPASLEDADVFVDKSVPCSRAVTPAMTRFTSMDKDREEVVDPTIVSEASKLKGVYWPGMDIFDSATPEMKRKRNQKKDTSVVEQLELNSREVEATEHIWTPCGTLHKERPISGSVTDSSPIKLDASPTKDLPSRPPLLELPTNIRNSSRQLRSRRRSPKKPNDNDLILEDELDLERALSQSSAENERTAAPHRKRRRDFEVLREDDDSEPFGHTTDMSILTSEFHPRAREMDRRSQPQMTSRQCQNPQPDQLLGNVPTQSDRSFSQQDFLNGLDLTQIGHDINPFNAVLDPLAVSFPYQQGAYFDNSVAFNHQFQPFQSQTDFGMLNGGFPTNGMWLGSYGNSLLNGNTFEADGTDLKAQMEEDDERTVTASTSSGN
ncbi:hypothetical protein MPH_08100 [Macrophomina phaseolina MS6]|uniref:Uncharacterized protein n=1 Tax=Macrophomina phaseolina (strain MS6) TaxID=1126212 RepID=K2SD95_MACPH|nr:hypothetical protein MPH_08100 [Macrophomina phaseolina MS6]